MQRSVKNRGTEYLPIELYNLKTDISETNNIATQHPEVVEKLERLMEEAHTPLN